MVCSFPNRNQTICLGTTIVSSTPFSMSSPTERFSQLSLGSMPPLTRLQSRMQEDEETDYDSDTDSGFDVDEESSMVTYPSNMTYSLHALDEHTRSHVINALSTDSTSKIVLRGCQSRGQDFIFELSELVEYTVRTGTANSQYAQPSCNCEQYRRGGPPCRHTLWLCDQITSQMLPYPEESLTLTPDGYSEQLGNACDQIPEFQFDVLADSLQCDLASQGQETIPSPRRVQTVREMLATLNETPVDEYRPDLFDPKKGKRVVKSGDLEQTIFRMLLRNHEFFSYFLSSMRNYDLLNPQFRRFRNRADAALAGLDEYAEHASEQGALGRKDVEWCARNLNDICLQILSAIFSTETRLDEYGMRAAARTLIHILREVVDRNKDIGPPSLPKDRRNLYFRLIGDKDRKFVLKVLENINPSAISHLMAHLVVIEEKILQFGVPPSYINKLRDIMSHVRSQSSSSGFATGSRKRTSQGQDRRAKRMK
ncbi:hypothetical protein F5X96DRAFT_267069 [Biscogniauxia mediterranea]|nr:hypothetical protein F5X96DRAFT_267069 [Biscogniauxia mediterranea]